MNSSDPMVVPARRVLLVEDEAMSRTLLANALRNAGYDVAVAASASEAVEEFKAFDPDALVSDIDLGDGPTGLDLVLSLTHRNPYLAVLVLSNYSITPDYRHGALANATYLSKKNLSDTRVLLDALDGVLRELEPTQPVRPDPTRPLDALTDAQLQVLRMVAEGLSNSEIAERRHCTPRAAEHMIHRIFLALGLEQDPSINTRVAAAMLYVREAGMPPPRPHPAG